MAESKEELEQQIPLIFYRLDENTKVLEEIRKVLSKQTENLAALLVLQEKHNNLQNSVTSLKRDLVDQLPEIEQHSKFVHQFYTGLKVFLFLFTMLQGIGWWIFNNIDDRIKKLEEDNTTSRNAIIVLQENVHGRHNPNSSLADKSLTKK